MKKVVLLGHGIGIKKFIETLANDRSIDAEVVGVVTHPHKDHKRDSVIFDKRSDILKDFYYNVFDVHSDYGMPLLESDNVNEQSSINWIDEKEPDYIISIGCRNIIKKHFLDFFEGKVFNIHTAPLPKYRGAAGDSWMILNGENGKTLFGCFHEVDTGIDTGRILETHEYVIPDKSYPIDVYRIRISIFPELIKNALLKLRTGNFQFVIQNNNEATTFPRLHTPSDGRIDFNTMNGLEIERFVYAFGYPFEGAHCYLDDKRINILEAEYHNSSELHPVTYGLIIGRNDTFDYKISVKGGILLIKRIEIGGAFVPQKKVFRLGKKLNSQVF